MKNFTSKKSLYVRNNTDRTYLCPLGHRSRHFPKAGSRMKLRPLEGKRRRQGGNCVGTTIIPR